MLEVHERLVIAAGEPIEVAWSQNTWLDPVEIEIESIADAVRKLRAIQRSWALHSVACHRRAALIAEALPPLSRRPLEFPSPLPGSPLGSFTLLAPDRMLASPHCTRPFPDGEIAFVEDREGPPSRAYLKLWELFTLLGSRPAPGELCLDLGASPGGWTWALARLGARVIAVDKAPLAPHVAAMPGVESRIDSAFAVDPESCGAVDWLFSDVVCYPARMRALLERWVASGRARSIVATIKFQGATDHETTRALAAVPGARLLHLHHNKHELTWVYELQQAAPNVT